MTSSLRRRPDDPARPGRHTDRYPTDRYIVDELCARHGKRIVLIDQFAMGPTFERANGMRCFQIAEAGIWTIAREAALGTELMVQLHDT